MARRGGGERVLRVRFVGDSASAERSARRVADATGLIGPQASASSQALQSLGIVGGTVGGTLKTALGVGIGVGAAQAARSIASFTQSAITDASALNEAMSATRQQFGEAADGLIADAADLAASGLSQRAALQGLNLFGAFFEGAGFAEQQSARFSAALVRLASDLASFRDISTDEALTTLAAGLAGETEPLRRRGVVFDANAVAAKAMELRLAGANDEIDEGAKVAARYALIIEKTTTLQGDFARTSDGLANAQRALQAEIENSKASLGDAFAPIEAQFLRGLRRIIQTLDKFDAGERGLGESFRKVLKNETEAAQQTDQYADALDGLQTRIRASADAEERRAEALAQTQAATSSLAGQTLAYEQAQNATVEAEERVADATRRAMRARADAAEQLDDLERATRSSALAEEEAAAAVLEAQDDILKAKTFEERAAAERALRRARLSQEEARDRSQGDQESLADFRERGQFDSIADANGALRDAVLDQRQAVDGMTTAAAALAVTIEEASGRVLTAEDREAIAFRAKRNRLREYIGDLAPGSSLSVYLTGIAQQVESIPDRIVQITADTGPAAASVDALKAGLAGLSQPIVLTVDDRLVRDAMARFGVTPEQLAAARRDTGNILSPLGPRPAAAPPVGGPPTAARAPVVVQNTFNTTGAVDAFGEWRVRQLAAQVTAEQTAEIDRRLAG